MQEPQQGGVSAKDIADLKAAGYVVIEDKDADPPTFHWQNRLSGESQRPPYSTTSTHAWQAAYNYYLP